MAMIEPIHIISLGAGVQSSVMDMMANEGLLTPCPDASIFADVKREPSRVYDWLEEMKLMDRFFPLIVVSKGNLQVEALKVRVSKKTGLTYMKHNIPVFMLRANGERGRMIRQCTNDFKIEMVKRESKRIAGRGRMIVMWIGISTDEASRMKDSKDPRIVHRYPLIEAGMSRSDCESFLFDRGFQAPRSSCKECPYHSDDHWLDMRENFPDEFHEAVQFEKDYTIAVAKVPRLDGIPFLHESLVPLDQVQFKKGNRTNHFTNECEGMCGV